MKLHLRASFLALMLASGVGHAVPPPTQLSPQLTAKLKKVILTSPLNFSCPVVSATAALGVSSPWNQKDFSKSGVSAQSAYTKPGVTHDSCWCVYRVSSPHVAGSETDFVLEREATNGSPVCQADSTTMSFSCYPLKPGEFY